MDWAEILKQGGLLIYCIGATYVVRRLWKENEANRKELVDLLFKTIQAIDNAVAGMDGLEEAIDVRQAIRDMETKFQSRDGADGG